jgi:hypothetical protein
MTKKLLILVAAVGCVAITPALAQHSHGAAGNAGGSHGPAMNNGSDHDSGSTSSKAVTSSSPTSLLTKNTKLDTNLTAKLQSKGLLPAGTDLRDACDGFKNLGQCVAAIHVSHNLDIPFACMKANMTGTTPAAGTTCPAGIGASKDKMSLGKSIQALSPTANSKTEATNAQKQGDADIKEAEANS